MDNWRHFLYYALGLLPSIFFGLRFALQWIGSEKRKSSHVGKIFWYLSICGNGLLSLHYFIQVQFLPFILQISNGFISWRNINLSASKRPLAASRAVALFLFSLAVALSVFLLQTRVLALPFKWIELPISLARRDVGLVWHILGSIGCVLFASRFWVQWIAAEKTGVSALGKHFWWISVWGSTCALTYFFYIHDWVSSINYSLGLIPYIRNLMLLRRRPAHDTGN